MATDKIEAYTYLDNLRESGECNMFYEPVAKLESEFGISKSEASEFLLGWQKAFSKTWDGENHKFVEEKTTA